MKIRIKVIVTPDDEFIYILQHRDILGWWNIMLKDVWKEKTVRSSDLLILDDLEKAKKVKSFLEKHKYLDVDMYEIVMGEKPIKITYIL